MVVDLSEYWYGASPQKKAKGRANNKVSEHKEHMRNAAEILSMATVIMGIVGGFSYGPTGIYGTLGVGVLLFFIYRAARSHMLYEDLMIIKRTMDAELAPQTETEIS